MRTLSRIFLATAMLTVSTDTLLYASDKITPMDVIYSYSKGNQKITPEDFLKNVLGLYGVKKKSPTPDEKTIIFRAIAAGLNQKNDPLTLKNLNDTTKEILESLTEDNVSDIAPQAYSMYQVISSSILNHETADVTKIDTIIKMAKNDAEKLFGEYIDISPLKNEKASNADIERIFNLTEILKKVPEFSFEKSITSADFKVTKDNFDDYQEMLGKIIDDRFDTNTGKGARYIKSYDEYNEIKEYFKNLREKVKEYWDNLEFDPFTKGEQGYVDVNDPLDYRRILDALGGVFEGPHNYKDILKRDDSEFIKIDDFLKDKRERSTIKYVKNKKVLGFTDDTVVSLTVEKVLENFSKYKNESTYDKKKWGKIADEIKSSIGEAFVENAEKWSDWHTLFGFGNVFQKSLENLKKSYDNNDKDFYTTNDKNNQKGNGSLMFAALFGENFENPNFAAYLAGKISGLTHGGDQARAACAGLASIVASLRQGDDLDTSIESGVFYAFIFDQSGETSALIQNAYALAKEGADPIMVNDYLRGWGSGAETLADGVYKAARVLLGKENKNTWWTLCRDPGDTDSTTAVAGSIIIAARNKFKMKFPKEWDDKILSIKDFEKYYDKAWEEKQKKKKYFKKFIDENGAIDVNKAKKVFTDIKNMQAAVDASNRLLKEEVPNTLKKLFQNDKNKELANTSFHISNVLKKGDLYLPTKDNLKRPTLKANVQQIFKDLLEAVENDKNLQNDKDAYTLLKAHLAYLALLWD